MRMKSKEREESEERISSEKGHPRQVTPPGKFRIVANKINNNSGNSFVPFLPSSNFFSPLSNKDESLFLLLRSAEYTIHKEAIFSRSHDFKVKFEQRK